MKHGRKMVSQAVSFAIVKKGQETSGLLSSLGIRAPLSQLLK